MQSHSFNLFKIENLHDLRTEYRVVEVDCPAMNALFDGEHTHQTLWAVAKHLSSRERVPVSVIWRKGAPLLAVPADASIELCEIQMIPEVVTIRPLDETFVASFAESGEGRNVA